MDTTKRKAGRPKAPPRTGPLVLGDDRGRTKVTLEISERAASELAEYARWVEQCSGLAPSEARFKTVDFALLETFRRDRLWQARQQAPAVSGSAPTTTSTAPSRPAAATSPSLPPPTPRDARVNP
jgi:hypothetical protein